MEQVKNTNRSTAHAHCVFLKKSTSSFTLVECMCVSYDDGILNSAPLRWTGVAARGLTHCREEHMSYLSGKPINGGHRVRKNRDFSKARLDRYNFQKD